MKSSESFQKLLSSPLPIVLISVFLFFTQFMFLFELSSISANSIFRVACNSVVLGIFLTISGKNKWVRYSLSGLLFCTGIIAVSIIVYVRYFHVIPTLYSLKLLSQAGDAAPSMPELISSDLLSLFFGIVLISILLLIIKPSGLSVKWKKIFIIMMFSGLLLPWFAAVINSKYFSGRKPEHFLSATEWIDGFGYITYLSYHFINIQSNLDYNNHIDNPVKTRSQESELPLTTPPYNFIVIQVESLDRTLIGRKTKDGIPIIPVISKLARENIYCPNIYSIHGPGGSSDAEFAVLTGLLPMNDHPVMLSHELSHIPSLAKVLKNHGYSAYALHGNDGTFWNRKSAYRQLGFDKFHDSESYSEWASGWKCLDGEFLKESIPYLEEISKNKPFFAYLITISMHAPYNITFVTEHNKNIRDENYQNSFYFQRANYTDRELGIFLSKLKQNGVLDNTIVIIFGDHTSGLKNEHYDCNKNISENVPLIIVHPDKRKGVISTFASQVDITPTILELAGITGNKSFFSRSLLRRFPERLFPIILGGSNYIQTPTGLKSIKDQKNSIYPQIVQYSRSYFYKTNQQNLEKNPFYRNRYIAHAMGSIDNKYYTNCLEAFEKSYKNGFRLMEVDLTLTKDGKLVCFHEGSEKDFGFKMPLNKTSHETFISKKILNKYTPLDFSSLLDLMVKYPDLYIVTDVKGKLEDYIPHIVSETRNKSEKLLERIIPQIYFPYQLKLMKKNYDFKNIIFTLYKTSKKELPDSKIIDFVKNNPEIKTVTVSIPGFSLYLSSKLMEIDIPLYVHTVNKPEIIDKLLSAGVYGFYTDVNSDFLNPVIEDKSTEKPKAK